MSDFFTAEIATQRNARLIADAEAYRLAKTFRKANRARHAAKTHSGSHVPDVSKVTMA